jgi:hypothetical protein
MKNTVFNYCSWFKRIRVLWFERKKNFSTDLFIFFSTIFSSSFATTSKKNSLPLSFSFSSHFRLIKREDEREIISIINYCIIVAKKVSFYGT